MTIYDELKARGLIAQVTDEEEIKEVISLSNTVCGVGGRIAAIYYVTKLL